jgi:hypothetical protein
MKRTRRMDVKYPEMNVSVEGNGDRRKEKFIISGVINYCFVIIFVVYGALRLMD